MIPNATFAILAQLVFYIYCFYELPPINFQNIKNLLIILVITFTAFTIQIALFENQTPDFFND